MATAALANREQAMRVRERPRGAPTKQTSVRLPKDQMDQIGDKGGPYGQSFAASVERLLDVGLDAIKELGQDNWTTEIQIRAIREQITEGEALGRYAREAIEREREQSGPGPKSKARGR